ncbi:hypothetical protein D5S17_34575 [Pseudonocardiaceae bacterium YIM PH 21723]|nr:hypothetical protein D5S17_34575 [Pseudonocardiaceae bacterium YIM PH 21723]
MTTDAVAVAGSGPAPRIELLSSFALGGRRRPLGGLGEILLARLALAGGQRVRRDTLITDLGLADRADPRAGLRTLIWRANCAAGYPAVAADRSHAWLAAEVAVDLGHYSRWCHRVITESAAGEFLVQEPPSAIFSLHKPLLPDWSAAWLDGYQEHWDVLRYECLELLTAALLSANNPASALVHAHRLTQQDPLRESAWRLLITAEIRHGRPGRAAARLDALTAVLGAELGVTPSSALRDLITGSNGGPSL